MEALAEFGREDVIVRAQSVKNNWARTLKDSGHDEGGKHLHDTVDEGLDSDDGNANLKEHVYMPLQKGSAEVNLKSSRAFNFEREST